MSCSHADGCNVGTPTLRHGGVEWALLAGLADDDRRRLVASLRRRSYARNEVIVHEGDPSDAMHLIERGRVRITLLSPEGESVDVAVLGSGQTFGELSLVREPSRRSATVSALEQTDTLVFRRDQLERLRRDHPAVDRFIAEVLAAQVQRLSSRLVESNFVPAHRRVIRRLLDLAAEYGDGDVSVVVPLTQEILAGLAGTTRPTVNQVLNQLANSGAIELARGRIVIRDLQAVRRRA